MNLFYSITISDVLRLEKEAKKSKIPEGKLVNYIVKNKDLIKILFLLHGKYEYDILKKTNKRR